MKKRLLLVLAVAIMGAALVLAVAYAAQQVPDKMTMNSKVYLKHTKTLVTFTHKKHNEDYKISCTECHHVHKDSKNVWKQGDEVQKCDACHSEAKAPTGKDAPNLSKEEKVKKYHYSAIHDNCKGCHGDLKKAGKPTGPTACKDCHPKPPKK